jgi:lipoprotein-anchoring transpeptidase ErfK/SrfK
VALFVVIPSSAIASVEIIAPTSVPAPVKLDYTPEPGVTTDNSVYSIGDRTDHLPTASPRATRIVLRLGERRVYVYDDELVLDSYPVAIGAPGTPTPTGQFEVFQMVVDPVWQSPWTGQVFAPGANSALGLRWIGFAELPGGIIGFHGTPTVSSIGKAASNGCVRLTNEDVLALYEHVRMGMIVVVEP